MPEGEAMSRHSARGRAWTALVQRVIAEELGICHLCGKPGADSGDHIIPASKAPHLRYERSNVRAAHRRCNAERRDRPVRPQPKTSRRWL